MALTNSDINKLKAVFATKDDLKSLPTRDDVKAIVDSSIEPLAASVAKGFAEVDKRFEQVDKRFDRLEGRMDRLEKSMNKVEKVVRKHSADITELQAAAG